ncbi:response regulator transcription factor, partial [Pontibacterium sp.]|uniref:response regulator transcription factor n=1 Tax=Pontibacterium sp. TaxID=2036026 RepID=UPI0035680416
MNVLIAEDDMNIRLGLKDLLEAEGYHCTEAEDGEAALAQYHAIKPDLILLDIMMPKMDGIEVCQHLKGDTSLSFMPIIMVTAKADTKDVVAGLDAGADEYLTKPVDQTALVARVKSMLRIKALHDTVQEQAKQLAEWSRTLEQRV